MNRFLKVVIFLLKKFKKMTRGKQIGVIIVSLIILMLVAYVIYTNFKPEPLPEYNVSKIYRGDIQTTYETKGTVSSANTISYKAANGVKVKDVFVSVGDRVKEGDQLATFDTSSLSETLSEYRNAYNKSANAYKKSASEVAQAKKNLSDSKKQVKQLDSEIASLKKEVAAADKVSVSSIDFSNREAIEGALTSGGFSKDTVNGILSSVKDLDRESVENAIKNTKAAKEISLQQKESQRQLVDTQISLYEMQAENNAVDIYKSVMQTKKADYDNYSALVKELANGWVANSDGIITQVNLVPGETFVPSAKMSTTTDISSILGLMSGDSDMSTILNDIMGSVSNKDSGSGVGMVLEDSGEFVAEFSVGKYDLLNIKTGQKVTVSSLGNVYDGEVIYVSATAAESSSLDISTLASTFTGSSAKSANGALVRVKIINPDEKVIIGFDVDISIDTEKISDVLVLPIDAVITEDGTNYVFTVNGENAVSKRAVTVGSYSDNCYELLDGLEAGETVIDNPKASMADGDKISIKKVLTENK